MEVKGGRVHERKPASGALQVVRKAVSRWRCTLWGVGGPLGRSN